MSPFKQIIFYFLLFLASACSDKNPTSENQKNEKAQFKHSPSHITNIDFNNEIIENEQFNMVDYFYVYNGAGVALGDLNNDGLADVFLSGNMVNDALYINQGDLKFKDITSKLGVTDEGWSTGVTMVDINHDGFLDIYVCRSGNFEKDKRKNLLYINQGDLTFKEQAEAYGLADDSYSTQAAFFDYDKDGDLDMYLLNHTNAIRDPNNIRPLISDSSGPANDRLYRNDEDMGSGIRFTDVTKQAAIDFDGLGLGLSIADLNNDGWEDIFVTNDFVANDYIYINQQDGTFKEMAKSYLNHVSHFSMGNDIADFNNDGLFDLITVDMRPKDNFHEKKMSGPLNIDLFQRSLQQGYMPQYMRNTLQVNTGPDTAGDYKFSEIGQLAGIDATDWSWAPLFADFDNDGLKDLFVTNGYLRDITDLDFINYTSTLYGVMAHDSLDHVLKTKAKEMPSIKIPNAIFKNVGNLTFEDHTDDWGFGSPSLSNGAAYADLDNDGDLDLVINNINEPASVYENQTNSINKNHYLNIKLVGDSLNPFGVGTEVRLFQHGSTQLTRHSVTRGYQSSVDHTLHFGLGSDAKIDSLLVTWPDGQTEKILAPIADQNLTITKNKGSKSLPPTLPYEKERHFKDVTKGLNVEVRHGETVYYDFNREYLLPHKLSEQGPGLAVGDIDNDGYEDFFMGGGYNHSGQLFFGSKTGSFTHRALTRNENERYGEDTGVLFFDYDNDQDLDLYIASGSNEFYEKSEYYQDRLYTNDGKGNFKLSQGVLPSLLTSNSCVRAADFDQDGDLDLFVGGRLTPLKYPFPPTSYLLINEGGKFTDATNKLAPSLRKPGMVTDALWTDYDADGDVDLIVVGEFMSIEFYENQNGTLASSSHKTGLSHTSGWWNSINGGDFDNDGDIDYIVGNLGLNSKYKATSEEPLSIYALDYDKNGTVDPILTTFNEGKEYPVHSRDDLIKQVPTLKKKFPDYASYARATISEVLSPQEKSSAYSAKVFQLASSILINQGDGTFEMRPLPNWAQVSPIYGIIISDFDKDGNLDLLVTGNDHGTEVGIGRYDASKGLYLKGTGTGDFLPVAPLESGLFVDGNSRGAVAIDIKGTANLIFGSNDGYLKAYAPSNANDQNKVLKVPTTSIFAKILLDNGKTRRHEFYRGSGYLSQSTRSIGLSGKEKEIRVFDPNGNETVINPKP
ncbi:VCBS repeat-containing protein [Zobellia galactanivorans]|uniref:VCBS repeat-containing protein n=1 Tax=Zobellia galactanivorans (strain DSM 12802 / CCUG 47099 / CIP 106680 / NCIMB 13871 / Dsij) TaxID=63186 RepID=UPI001C079371|nr:VCBS repeat-containing protein [Zobellia galactanivorans]MBU3028484.1 VCBS repeat-containing protein [Zobellia galactanivorans]